MRHGKPTKSNRIVLCSIILIFLGLIFFYFSAFGGKHADVAPTPQKWSNPHSDIVSLSPRTDTYKKRSTQLHDLRAFLARPENKNLVEDIENRCSTLSQHDQLKDTECTANWLNILRENQIIGVSKLWGFEDTHFGAITLDLEGGYRAMFKPCSSKSEDTSKEVIASYLDQLLGWGQTAPVITRKIPTSTISRFVFSAEDKQILNETITRCANKGTFVGPMIGWWDSLIPVRTTKKYKVALPDMPDMRKELSENLLTAQMQSKYHAFYMLINILRHGKDEFITRTGDLVSLDLDRSRFQSTVPLTDPAVNFTWCYTCYMDKWVYDTFQAVGPRQSEENRLGTLMRTMLSYEDIFPELWDKRLSEALDTRVDMLLGCIDDCIFQYGRDQVLLDEPRNMSPKELVEWFVSHSLYKDRNGQMGPTNLDFLDELE